MDFLNIMMDFVAKGFEHIIPLGLDHILFILCLFFKSSKISQVVQQSLVFTVAHSITLALAIFGVIHPPSQIVEPLIALSIIALAIENIFVTQIRYRHIALVFLFGLVHGMGFASALSQLQLPSGTFTASLLGFNIGVELGQICVIFLMYFCVSRNFAKQIWYRKRIVIPASVIIAICATFMLYDRIFN